MKKLKYIVIAAVLFGIVGMMFIGPFNMYHYLFAEKIVKEQSVFFSKPGYPDLDNEDEFDPNLEDYYDERIVAHIDDITRVEYLGRNTFLIETYKEGDAPGYPKYIWKNDSKGNKYNQSLYMLESSYFVIGFPGRRW